MDPREIRRTAAKAARRLVESKIDVISDLAVAAAARAESDSDIAVAKQRAQQIIDDARATARKVITDARKAAADRASAYAEAYRTAVSAGWTADELTEIGYDAPPRARTNPRRPATPAQSKSLNPPDAAPPSVAVSDAPVHAPESPSPDVPAVEL